MAENESGGKRPTRPVPRGKALELTEEEWDAAAEVTPTDVAQAGADWRRDAPPGFGELLDATPEEVPE